MKRVIKSYTQTTESENIVTLPLDKALRGQELSGPGQTLEEFLAELNQDIERAKEYADI